MTISVEITSSLGRRLTVTVPVEEQVEAEKKRLQEVAKKAKIDGFRPGKVPVTVVKKMFGESIRQEVIEKLLENSLRKALQQENLRPAGYPVIESLKAEADQPMEYCASFEIYPEVKVRSLSTVTVEKLNVAITDAEVEHVLGQIQKQYAEWKSVERAVQAGDRITAETAQIVEGESTQENQAQKFILDKESLKLGFEKLVGSRVGDEVTVDLTLPHQHDHEHHHDHDHDHDHTHQLKLRVKITAIEEPELPALDEAFAIKLGVKEGSLAALRDEVKERMQTELNEVLKNKLRTQVVEKLLELHTVELPKALVEAEVQRLTKEISNRNKQEEHVHLSETEQAELTKAAQRNVTLSLLYPAILKEHDIKLDDERLRARIEQLAKAFQDIEGAVRMIYQNENILNNISSQVLEEQIIEKLLEQVQFAEKSVSYSEVMNLTMPA